MDVTKPLLLSASVRWHRIPGITQPKWSPGLIYISLVTRSSLPLGVAPFMQDCAKLLPHTRPLWRFLPPSQPCPGGPSMHLSLGLPDSLSFVLLQSSPLLSALSYQPEGMLGTTHLTMSLFCSTFTFAPRHFREVSGSSQDVLRTSACPPHLACSIFQPQPLDTPHLSVLRMGSGFCPNLQAFALTGRSAGNTQIPFQRLPQPLRPKSDVSSSGKAFLPSSLLAGRPSLLLPVPTAPLLIVDVYFLLPTCELPSSVASYYQILVSSQGQAGNRGHQEQ